jgi:tetratricopeptide (TPR) repeat protein
MAIALDRNLLDALFNRALLYQQMSRFADARDAWEEYLRKDATSPWADEARKRIKDIEDQKKISSLSEGV